MKRNPGPQKHKSRALANLMSRCVTGAALTQQEMEDLLNRINDTEPSRPPEPVGSTVLHRIGRVELTKHVFRDRSVAYDCSILAPTGPAIKIYERSFSGRSVVEAIEKARRAYPRPVCQIEGEIVAVRSWELQTEFLCSLNGGGRADHLVLCGPVQTSHEPPSRHNSSGLYSVKPPYAPEVLRSYNAPVYGLVGVYGRVIEHAKGYRSSHYIIRRLIFRTPCSERFAALFAERYDCEVKLEHPL